jgi:hypothetical protein
MVGMGAVATLGAGGVLAGILGAAAVVIMALVILLS